MPGFLLSGPFPAEFPTGERCAITELLNHPACPEVSLARARVAPGVTTRLHSLAGIVERYVILAGGGVVEVGGIAAAVGPGDRVLIPAGMPQRIACTGAGDLVFDCVCTPRFVPAAYVDLEGAGGAGEIGAW
jgi:mannose-6-phosphate isomerase-like protein (cupin superfamily)